MTVIAYLPSLSLAFSDLLMSMEVPGGSSVLLPTVGATNALAESLPVTPTRLVRKVHRLKVGGAEVHMLLAGTGSHLRTLIENFEAVRSGKQILPDDLQRHFDRSDPLRMLDVVISFTERSGLDEFEVIAFHKDRHLDYRSDAGRSLRAAPYFGDTIIAGGGAADLYRWLSDRGDAYLRHPLTRSDSAQDKHNRTLNLVPSMLLEEDTRDSLRTLRNGVGGYYEVFQVDQEGLHPVDAVLTVFAAVEGKGRGMQIALRRLFFHLYANDCLFIISLFNVPRKLKIGEAVRVDVDDFELFKVAPLFADVKPPNWTAARLLVRLPSAELCRLTLYRESDETGPPLIKRYSEGRDTGHPFLSISVTGHSAFLTLEKHHLDYFLARFPSDAGVRDVVTLHR